MVPYEGATGHWAMAVVWPNDREVVWYDSLPGYAHTHTHTHNTPVGL
jgi:hypothetical protein